MIFAGLGLFLQAGETDSLSAGNTHMLMIFVGIVAFAMLIQSIAVIVMVIGAAKARKRMMEIVNEVRTKAMPMIVSTHEFIRETTPKIKVITENLVETSHVIRTKAHEYDVTLTEVNAKTRAQVARVDSMVTTALTATGEIAATIQNGIRTPVREFAGMMNGLKAAVDVLAGKAKGFGTFGRGGGRTGGDSDLFV